MTPALGFASNLSYTIVRRKRTMIGVRAATIRRTLRSASPMKSWHCSVPHGPRKGCYAVSSITRPRESERRARLGWMYSLSSKKGSSICSPLATMRLTINAPLEVEIGWWVFHFLLRHEAWALLTHVRRKLPTTLARCSFPIHYLTLYLHPAIIDSAHFAWY